MQMINLSLTLEEINVVLEGLGQMPYVRVYQLIANIQQQTASQLSVAQAAEAQRESALSTAETEPNHKGVRK